MTWSWSWRSFYWFVTGALASALLMARLWRIPEPVPSWQLPTEEKPIVKGWTPDKGHPNWLWIWQEDFSYRSRLVSIRPRFCPAMYMGDQDKIDQCERWVDAGVGEKIELPQTSHEPRGGGRRRHLEDFR